MAEDFIGCFSNYVFDKFKKTKMTCKKLTVKLNFREPNAAFEPVKYGGMGYCLSQSKTFDKISCKFDVEMVRDLTLSALKSFQIKSRVRNLLPA